ncbi:MAG: 50S ribosomal protein L21 [Proteobacteria bacterium]|nr:50S ribosomal protein L21 [Pseudomonadota bacterium]MBU1742373.1 50S ribosomal protein L21 [Pseudomonadota bacterium]
MYAVIEQGGKQYRVHPGDVVRLERLDGRPGDELTLDRVLMVNDEGDLKVGRPLVEGASVSGTILEQHRAKKIIVYKYKRRKKYRRKQGHRQHYTAVKIQAINV